LKYILYIRCTETHASTLVIIAMQLRLDCDTRYIIILDQPVQPLALITIVVQADELAQLAKNTKALQT
jgi:hypothetical protein